MTYSYMSYNIVFKLIHFFYHILHKNGMHMSLEIYVKTNYVFNKDKTRSALLKNNACFLKFQLILPLEKKLEFLHF